MYSPTLTTKTRSRTSRPDHRPKTNSTQHQPTISVWLFLAIVVLFGSFCEQANAMPPLILEPRSVDAPSLRCDARVSASPKEVGKGGVLRIRCEIYCATTTNLYNPFLREDFRLPARVIIASADGRTGHELLQPADGARKPSDDTAWVSIRGGSTLGREFAIRVGPAHSGVNDRQYLAQLDLAPGEYFVQAIYSHWLVPFWPNSQFTLGPRVPGGDEPQPQAVPGAGRAMNDPYIVSEPIKFVVIADDSKETAEPVLDDAPPVRLDVVPDRQKIRVGEQLGVELRITNVSQKVISIYNPTLNGFLSPYKAVALEFTNEKGVLIGDLLAPGRGSAQLPRRRDWYAMPPGATVSSRRTRTVGSVPGTQFNARNPLPAGRYFLEFNAREALFSGLPEALRDPDADPSESVRKLFSSGWREQLRRPVVCRSNRVELEILPRTGD
jgi:hypothetical protein